MYDLEKKNLNKVNKVKSLHKQLLPKGNYFLYIVVGEIQREEISH